MNLSSKLKGKEIRDPIAGMGSGENCSYKIWYKTNELIIRSSNGGGWDHVSVSVRGMSRLPTWNEMEYVKGLFWGDDETVLQFHPKKAEYRSIAKVLHLWKKQGVDHELPPGIMVAPKTA